MSHTRGYRPASRIAATALALLVSVAAAQISTDFDLPAQPLSDALRALAARTNANILFDRALVSGRYVPALKLHATMREALDRILTDTGLTYRALDENTVVIVPVPVTKHSYHEPPEPPPDEFTTDPAHGLPEITITAERRITGEQDVAASVTALTGAMLDESGIWNLEQLPLRTPGLLVSNNGAYGQPYLRGVGSDIINPGADSPVAVFIDGAYQARQIGALTDLYDVDRVEVLKGPQGTLYGRNASAGAINVITNDVEPALGESADVYFGSYDTLHLRGFINVPVGDDSGFRVAGLFSRRDGYTLNLVDGTRINDENVAGLRTKFKYSSGARFSLVVGAEYTREDDSRNSANKIVASPALPLPVRDLAAQFGYPPLVLPADPLEVQYNFAPNIYVSEFRLNGTARWHWEGLDLTSVSAFTNLHDIARNDLDATAIDFAYDREADVSQAFSQTLQLSAAHWLAGLEYFHEQGGQNFDARLPPFGPASPIALGPDSPVPGFVWSSSLRTQAVAGFVDGSLALSSRWTVNAGVRYSWERKAADFLETVLDPTGELTGVAGTVSRPAHPERSFSAWTPKFRLEYRPAGGLLLYGSVTRGFKSGGFNLMNLAETFLPEKLWSFETGLKASWLNNRLRTNAAAFYYDYRNLQVNQFSGVTNLVTNAANSRVTGFELELAGLPATWLRGDLALALLDARYRSYLTQDANSPQVTLDLSGNRMPHAPRATLTTGLEAGLPVRQGARLTLRTEMRYQSLIYFDQFDTRQLAQDGYWLVDAQLQFAAPRGAWTVALVGANLGNRIYRQSVIRVDNVFGTEADFGAPRTYGVRFATHF